VRIAISVSGDLMDIQIFRISISRKVCISSSVEIQIGDRSNAIIDIRSEYADVGVYCFSRGYMVNAINDYEIIGIIAQSDLGISHERIESRSIKERMCWQIGNLVEKRLRVCFALGYNHNQSWASYRIIDYSMIEIKESHLF
jgi:hypothetical protein